MIIVRLFSLQQTHKKERKQTGPKINITPYGESFIN